MSLFHPDWAYWFRGGVRPFLGRAVRKVCSPVVTWETLRCFSRDLSATPMPEPRPASLPVEVRTSTLEEMRVYFGEGAEVADERFAKGDLCFVAVLDRRIVHYTWLSTRPTYIPELGARIRLNAGETYVYYSFTEEGLRGSGVQAAVATEIVRYQKRHGYVRHFLFINAHNYSAMRVIRRIRPAPIAVRAVTRFRFLRGRSYLVVGIVKDDALFEVERSATRPCGRLGYWLSATAD